MSDPQYRLKAEIKNVQQIMVENIEKVMERGENIEGILTRTESLNRSALNFRKRTAAIRASHNRRKYGWIFGVIVLLILAAYLSATAACGFPTLDRCIGQQ